VSATAAMPAMVDELVGRYLRQVDAAVPGAIEGFYVVGSTALGAFRPGRSDVDFVAVVGDRLGAAELGRLRRAQRRLFAADLAHTVLRPPWRWPLTCNGVFVTQADLARPPLTVVPGASHTSWRFASGRGFDVNPVTWRVLARRGIAVRGPAPDRLSIHHDEMGLRQWCLRNLDGYWRRWASAVLGPGWEAPMAGFLHGVAGGVLGAPRLHRTVLSGDIISKEEAGEYALAAFGGRWRPMIEEALAYWRGELRAGPFRPAGRRRREAARFVLEVVESASAVSGAGGGPA
jgi:Domain of unknown function (DUF4111)